MKRGNKPYSVTFESLVMRLVKQFLLSSQKLISLNQRGGGLNFPTPVPLYA